MKPKAAEKLVILLALVGVVVMLFGYFIPILWAVGEVIALVLHHSKSSFLQVPLLWQDAGQNQRQLLPALREKDRRLKTQHKVFAWLAFIDSR